MSPSPTGEIATGVNLAERALRFVRRPLVTLACWAAGINAAERFYELETRRLARDHELKVCDELDECVQRIEELGPLIWHGSLATPGYEKANAEYIGRKHRLRDLDPALPALCESTARPLSSPEEWQKIAQLARPAIAARRARALGRR